MGLSCSCDDYDGDGWYFYEPKDYAPLATKRSRKCCSCKARIAVGDLSVMFERQKQAGYDTVKEKIYGEGGEIPMAPWFMCERCGDLYFSLSELGFCVTIGEESMPELAREYAAMNRDASYRMTAARSRERDKLDAAFCAEAAQSAASR